MRDAKLLFRNKVAATTASAVVDTDSSRPGQGCPRLYYSATVSSDATVANGAVCTILTASTEAGAMNPVATFTITTGIGIQGGVVLTTPLPSECRRFVTTTWTGITGGTMTDGLDYGLTDGTEATQPYLA